MKRAIILSCASALLFPLAASAQIKFTIGPDNQPTDSASAENMRLYRAMNQRLAGITSGLASSCFEAFAAYQGCKGGGAPETCGTAPVCSAKGKLPPMGFSGIRVEFPDGKDAATLVPSGVAADPTSTSKSVRLSGGVIQGKRLSFVQPEYPSMAKAGLMSGVVVLHARISKEGQIKDLEVSSATNLIFEESAIDAVRRWRYQPYLLNGIPSEVETTITVNYMINKPSQNPSAPAGPGQNSPGQFPQLGPPH